MSILQSPPRGVKGESVYVWNPVGFEPELCLPAGLSRYGDYARYLLHRIIQAGIFDRRLRGEFVPLKAQYMREFFPSNAVYGRIRTGLIEGGAVECDGRYLKGEKAFGYKLGAGLAGRRHQRVEVTNRKLAAKIRASRAAWLQAPESPIQRHLWKNLVGLEIDYPAALEWLMEAGEFDPSDETAAQMIRDRQFRQTVCDYGRVHTNLTNLRRGLRNFLTHGGSTLVNLDVANSQPLVFGLVLMKRFGAGAMPADVRLYLDLVQAGEFYEFLMGEWDVPAEARQDFKQRVYGHILYCDTRHETTLAAAFGRMFPTIYRVILEMKAGEPPRAYAAFAHAMQRAESDLMIGRIAERCMREMPGSVLLTIHDSIVTTPDQAGAAGSVMVDEFAKVGVQPRINVDHLQTTHTIRQL